MTRRSGPTRADSTVVRVASDRELIADTVALVIRPSHVQFRPVLADSMTGVAPPTTSAATEVDNRERDVWLAEATYPGDPVAFLHLGPTPIREGIIESARALRGQTGQWAVNPVFFTGAADGDGRPARRPPCPVAEGLATGRATVTLQEWLAPSTT